MTDAVFMDFEEPTVSKAKPKKKSKSKKTPIPQLPRQEMVLTGDEIRRGVSERSRSAANLKVEGYSYGEIADLLEFDTPADARRAVEGVLAAIHDPGEYDSLRLIAIARAEERLKLSSQMAKADFLVTDDGDRLPNLDKLRWHQAAGVDLMNWALITGTKAPTKIELTPGEADLERIVTEIARRSGHEDIVDAEVIELEALPAPKAHRDEEWDDDTVQG